MANVFDAAKYILEREGEIYRSKLQCLLYFSQAKTINWTGKPLFPEDFEAWWNGPTCPQLADRFANLPKNSLTAEDIPDANSDNLIPEQKRAENIVLRRFGPCEYWWLIWQCQKEKPYKDHYKEIRREDIECEIIPKEAISNFYRDNFAWRDYIIKEDQTNGNSI